MDKRESEPLKVFDGTKFPVWKFYMELCFATKDMKGHVNGTLPAPGDDASEADKAAWQKKDELAMQLIGASVTLPVLENLINCTTATSMWSSLCAFYQHKSKENIHMIQNSFFEYRMSIGDSINTHINKVLTMAKNLKDLGKPVEEDSIITKIICSLPPSYNSIVTAWANLPIEQQNVANLKVRLLQLEDLLALQGGETSGDSAFFTRSNKVSSQHKQHHHESNRDHMTKEKQNSEYIRGLKSRTRCYNCGEFDHWTAECPRPRQDKTKFSNNNSKRSEQHQHNTRNKTSEANAVTKEQVNSSSSDPPSDSERDTYAFMTITRQSHALSVNMDKQVWYADSGATEHMTEHRDWFSTFKPIPQGTWAVTVADDRNIWVQGVGDINITRTVDGVSKEGVLKKVLYIPDLRRNLFSIGLASKAGLSFQTHGDRCALYHNFGKGPKVMEGVQIGTLYKLSITPVPSSPVHQTSSTALTVSSRSTTDITLWHNRMGHVNTQVIKKMSDNNSLQDFTISLTNDQLPVCKGCALGKQHKATYPVNPNKERSTIPGEVLHADICGKMSQPSLGGALYYILIKDDCTFYRFVTFIKAKSDALRFFTKIIRYITRSTGNHVKTLRTDRGKEFCNTEFDLLLEHEGITRETSTPYTPQQNGYIERDNRTVCKAARSMLHLHNVPLTLWAESVHTAVYLLNRTINNQVGSTTPYELWFKTKPTVSHYRTFGIVAYILTDKSLRTKFQAKGVMVIFVGYSTSSKGWRFWNPSDDTISESSDVIFDENTGYSSSLSPTHGSSVDIPYSLLFPSITDPVGVPPPIVPVGVPPPIIPEDDLRSISLPPLNTDSTEPSSTKSVYSPPHSPVLPPNDADSQHHPLASPSSSDPYDINIPLINTSSVPDSFEEPLHPKFKSLTELYTPSSPTHSNSSSHSSFVNMIHTAETYREPSTYKQTTMSPQAQYWKATMEKEYESLMENRTWILVPPPPGRNIIQCKWVYKIKYTSDGAIDKYKAHLVAKGYSQVHGIDYTETFSPVIKHDSIRVIFAIAAVLRMHMKQFDIGTAYLNSDLTTRIYMQQPEGFANPKTPLYVCLLLKSLYGLKQSGRLWNHTFDHFLKLYNLLTSDADTCVYYQPTASNSVDLIVGIFVDDGIVCASNPADLDNIINHLASIFKVTHGPMDYYVGFQVHHDPIHHTIFINQARYLSDILQRFQLDQANPVSTPADTHMPLQATLGPDDQPLPTSVPYREAVGCLMYAMVLHAPILHTLLAESLNTPVTLTPLTGLSLNEFFVIFPALSTWVSLTMDRLKTLLCEVTAMPTMPEITTTANLAQGTSFFLPTVLLHGVVNVRVAPRTPPLKQSSWLWLNPQTKLFGFAASSTALVFHLASQHQFPRIIKVRFS